MYVYNAMMEGVTEMERRIVIVVFGKIWGRKCEMLVMENEDERTS